MLGINLLLMLPLIVTVRSDAAGVGYYGSSNVRTQGLNLPPLYRPLPVLQPRTQPQPVVPVFQPASETTPVKSLQPAPQPEQVPIPEPITESDLISQTEPIPEVELISESTSQPAPLPDSIPEPTLQSELLPDPIPKPVPQLEPFTDPIPEPTLLPTTQSEQTTVTLPPVANTSPIITVYKPIHGGHLEYGFDCKMRNGYYAIEGYCDQYIACKKNIAVRYFCPDGLNFNPAAKWFQYPCVYPSEVQCEAGSKNQSPKPTAECPRQHGLFPIVDGDCSKYITCQEGKATLMDCPYGLVFNVETSSCDWPENVPLCNPKAFKDFDCPESHVNQDGEISDYIYKYRYGGQCKLYVACQRGHPRLLSCDYGLLFHEPSQSCINEDLVTDCDK